MSGRRLLLPFFLAPLDRYLRNNRPLIWRTRAHIVLFYSLLPINILCYLLGNFREIDLAHIPTGSQLLLQAGAILLAVMALTAFWANDQRRRPLPRRGWSPYLLTTGLYWLCLLSFGVNILIYLTPVIQRTAALLPSEYVDRAYQIDQKWYECRRCDCPPETVNRASPEDQALMLHLAEQMGYDTLKQEPCNYSETDRVYLVVEDGYLSRARNFHNRIVSLRDAQAFNRGRGAYRLWFYRLLPLGFLVFGWLSAQWLFLGSVRGSRPRRERQPLFTGRELLDLWIIGRLDRWLLRNHPWWWNVQLHRWLFYVLFWGALALLALAFSLPLRLGNIVDDLAPFALVLFVWTAGGIGWFIGWVYERSLLVVVRKDPWRNLLLVLGYLLAFYALLFNVGVFSAALAYRLDRLLPDEQLMQDMRYRLDNMDVSGDDLGFYYSSYSRGEAPLFTWRDQSGFEEYYFVESSLDAAQTAGIHKLKKEAEGLDAEFLNQRLLEYANQMLLDGKLPSIPEAAPGDTTIEDRLEMLNTQLRSMSETPESIVDSLIAEQITPLEQELRQLREGGGVTRGNDYLNWQIARLKAQQATFREELDLVYDGLAEMDRLIQDRLLSVMDSLMKADPVQTQQTRDTLFSYRRQFLEMMGYRDVPVGISFEAFLSYSPQGFRYSAVAKEIERLEKAREQGGYRSLSREEQKGLMAERAAYLEQEIAEISQNRYRIKSEWMNRRMGPVQSEIQWLEGLRGPVDYFNHALGLFMNRRLEKTVARQGSTGVRLQAIESQAAELATLNTRYFPGLVLEIPVDLCRELENLRARESRTFVPDMDRQENLELLDFGCRYRIREDSRLARLAGWVADRFFDTHLSFQYASKLAPAWAAVLEAKNFRSGQGIVYNLLTLYIPLYALPFVLTYIFIALSFYYFSPASAGLTALATLFFFIFLSLLPSRFILEDPTWAYLLIGAAVTGYGFFYRGNHTWMNYLALAWFLCSPLFLVVGLTDRWGRDLEEMLTIAPYSLATEPASLLWMIWLGYLVVNLIIVLIGVRVFARQAYLPK